MWLCIKECLKHDIASYQVDSAIYSLIISSYCLIKAYIGCQWILIVAYQLLTGNTQHPELHDNHMI